MSDEGAGHFSGEVYLSSISQEDLFEMELPNSITVYIPLPSIGRTNSHIDICSDLIDASWAAEQLAKLADLSAAEELYFKETYSTQIKLTLHECQIGIKTVLSECLSAFNGDDPHKELSTKKYQEIRDSICDFEDKINEIAPRFPGIVDCYHVNLVEGAHLEYQSDAPDYYEEQISKYPERQTGFYRSAFSAGLGADIYVSSDSWVTPLAVDVDEFFKETSQRYRLDEFIFGSIFSLNGSSYVIAEGDVLAFPMSQYFKSRTCMSLIKRDEIGWPPQRFAWEDATFTSSPYLESLRQRFSVDFVAPTPIRERCLVHKGGSLILVEDGENRHFLYDTDLLKQEERKGLLDQASELVISLSDSIGLSPDLSCDWSSLTDDDFENLCYDVISSNPKFDNVSIRKMGKSRSRDGGRDIVVFETSRNMETPPRKWIFQCKLIRDGSSLTKTKLTDVGDMLDQYEAQGFGVMTSAVIDSTLYDKLDGVCNKRGIKQHNFSILELERYLARYKSIRGRYFPGKI